MSSWEEKVYQVRERAGGRCEYCRMHQSLQGGTFHVEHIIPSSKGGAPELENLAWACPGCNLRKSDHLEAPDPKTGKMAPLFNPRLDLHSRHFRRRGYRLIGMTPIGRATTQLLEFNHPRRILIRKAEELFGLNPPKSGGKINRK